jgi:hypothetical protein
VNGATQRCARADPIAEKERKLSLKLSLVALASLRDKYSAAVTTTFATNTFR